ncbi:MAG: chemotaxis protein CheW [Planctomycetes bacterium]|nr:chemotaxis protein CheW [Planctomycetota bacterium]
MAETPRETDELLETAKVSRVAARQAELGGGEQTQIIVFTVGGREYAVPIDGVERTERPSTVTPVPRSPEFVRGVASLRGAVLCVIDLGNLLTGEPSEADPRSFLVLTDGARRLAVQSEDLPDFVRIDKGHRMPPPASNSEVYSGAVERDFEIVGVIDPERLFDLVEQRLAGSA